MTDRYNLERNSLRYLMRSLLKSPDAVLREHAFKQFSKRLSQKINVLLARKFASASFSVQEREDIASEVSERLQRYFPRFKGNSRQYLVNVRRIIISVCADILKDRILDELPADWTKAEELDDPVDRKAKVSEPWSIENDGFTQPSPETSLEENEALFQDWEAALPYLDEACRSILPLLVAGKQNKEVAAALDLSLRGAQRLRQRCLDSLPVALANSRVQSLLALQAEALSRIKPSYAKILRLHFDNLSDEAIAIELGISHNNARAKLSRSRDKLKREMLRLAAGIDQVDKIENAIDQLSPMQRTLALGWWQGEQRVSHLAKLFSPPLEAVEAKQLLSDAFHQLYIMLTTPRSSTLKEDLTNE